MKGTAKLPATFEPKRFVKLLPHRSGNTLDTLQRYVHSALHYKSQYGPMSAYRLAEWLHMDHRTVASHLCELKQHDLTVVKDELWRSTGRGPMFAEKGYIKVYVPDQPDRQKGGVYFSTTNSVALWTLWSLQNGPDFRWPKRNRKAVFAHMIGVKPKHADYHLQRLKGHVKKGVCLPDWKFIDDGWNVLIDNLCPSLFLDNKPKGRLDPEASLAFEPDPCTANPHGQLLLKEIDLWLGDGDVRRATLQALIDSGKLDDLDADGFLGFRIKALNTRRKPKDAAGILELLDQSRQPSPPHTTSSTNETNLHEPEMQDDEEQDDSWLDEVMSRQAG